MDTKRYPAVHGGNNATVIDLAKYKRGLKSAVKKPRKGKTPKFEIVVCDCGGSDFKFVLASDVDHLRNKIVCSMCHKAADEPTLHTMMQLAKGLL